MSTYKTLLVDRIGSGDRIARVTLNRPEKANSLNDELSIGQRECPGEMEAGHEVCVAVLHLPCDGREY